MNTVLSAAVGIGSLLVTAGLASPASAEHSLLEHVSSGPAGGNGPDEVRNELVRVELTFPTDLNAGPNSVKATRLGGVNLLETGLDDADVEDGIFGLAFGREVSPGKRIVYMTDWNGNILTLRPR